MISLIQQKKIDKNTAQRIRRYCKKITEYLNITEKSIIIILTDNNQIQKLNKDFFKKNKPTNVISFPFDEKDFLGEIYISVEYAAYEAKEWEVSFFYEMMYLIIHGILHLLGYDHVNSKDEAEVMEQKEIEIIRYLNLKKQNKTE